MTIGELARRTGLTVRTLRFYADAGVLPEAARSGSGYRLFGPDAVARARLLRTLRELGVGLEDIKRVLAAEVSLSEIADRHARALDARIRTLRLQRAVLRAVATSTNAEELQRMTALTTMTADERRRILDDYLDEVFGDHASPVAKRLRTGAPELPDDPSADQVAAWVELVELLRGSTARPRAAAAVGRREAIARRSPDHGDEESPASARSWLHGATTRSVCDPDPRPPRRGGAVRVPQLTDEPNHQNQGPTPGAAVPTGFRRTAPRASVVPSRS
jgi:DNA-binding transcriptional MerR regulator